MNIIIPTEVIYHIYSYLKWKDRTILLNKEFLKYQFRTLPRLSKFSSKVRLYSYRNVFGREIINISWMHFCKTYLEIYKRARDDFYRLSWKAAAETYFLKRCKGCGSRTNALVFGCIPICCRCRHNDRLKNCYMVSVTDAINKGISRKLLRSMPYHGSSYGRHLRFWKDIQDRLKTYRIDKPR